jgi:hypothetical protein
VLNDGRPLLESVQRYFLLFVIAISLFIILSYALSMGLGVFLFFSTWEGLEFAHRSITLHPLLIQEFQVTMNVSLYFLLLWWIFVLCFVAASRLKEGFHRKFISFMSKDSSPPWSSNLLTMPAVAAMLLTLILVLEALQEQSGFPSGELPVREPFLDLILVSQAPIIEELLFRIIPFALFFITYTSMVQGNRSFNFSSSWLRKSLMFVLRPDEAKKSLGLKNISTDGLLGGVSAGEWTMVISTSIIFGIAHFLSGWGPGKITQASLTGVVFALSYLYYGIQAPILLHWFFNYYFEVFKMADKLFNVMLLDYIWSMNVLFGFFIWATLVLFCVIALIVHLRKNISQASKHVKDSEPSEALQ